MLEMLRGSRECDGECDGEWAGEGVGRGVSQPANIDQSCVLGIRYTKV